MQRLSLVVMVAVMAALTSVAYAGQHPTSFMWIYRSQPQPGLRVWSFIHGNWAETYPDGHTALLGPGVPATVNGCTGSVITLRALGGAQSFVPDINCAQMALWFRRPNGAWASLGQMRAILYCPQADDGSSDKIGYTGAPTGRSSSFPVTASPTRPSCWVD